MKKPFLIIFLLLGLIFFIFPQQISAADYIINNFQSKIILNQDASLTVTERIEADFQTGKHGIFRFIPVVYSSGGKTIRASFTVISVEDENNNPYPYEISRQGTSIIIKIGDPHSTVSGRQTYIIRYQISKIIQRFTNHEELYWNITGHEWDAEIKQAGAVFKSPWAPIIRTECFAGAVSSKNKDCLSSFTLAEAEFKSEFSLIPGKDMTVVIGLGKNNQLRFPSRLESSAALIADNWGYFLALAPLFFLFTAWYKKSRDRKYAGDNPYYIPNEGEIVAVPLFAREHLPMAYSPIKGLTPSQAGTIIDEKVDIQDVVGEIIELARLGFLEIYKIEKPGILRKSLDYLFVKKGKDSAGLRDYQRYLLEKIFEAKADRKKLKEYLKEEQNLRALEKIKKNLLSETGESFFVFLTDLKNEFYQYLEKFRERLYENVTEAKYFTFNPDRFRTLWAALGIIFFLSTFFILSAYSTSYDNNGPLILLFTTIIPGIILIKNMPQRSAWGYSLFRQITGLRFYIEKGKWREEIAEKNLFLEEILPLAISLGVVKQLAKDMADLAVPPPSYFHGFTSATFYSDLNHFNSAAVNNLTASSGGSWSGKSSWSGGSGFGGGGFSGGGFGGGGGRSW